MTRSLEQVARESTGRLVAALARRCGDVTLAEDAVSTALVTALEQWTEVPDDPEAWLFTVARRRLADAWRHDAVRDRKAAALASLQEAATGGDWPDDRLPLLFVCAHPAIAADAHALLMLQAVLRVPAVELAPLVARSPSAVGQQLWRAKQKIKEAGIPFVVPEGPEFAPRLVAVLDAIRAAWFLGSVGRDVERRADALWLAQVVVQHLDHDEAWGLLSLLWNLEARADDSEVYRPLSEQDPTSWDPDALARADAALRRAHRGGTLGSFQLEAALQNAVTLGRTTGTPDHLAILSLYDALVDLSPTHGHRVGRVAAVAEAKGAEAGWCELQALPPMTGFQPYWAVRADLARRLCRPDASAAYARAVELTSDERVARWLRRRAGVAAGPESQP